MHTTTKTLQNRLTIAQKLLLCEMASSGMPSPTKLADWANTTFPLAKPLTDGGVRYILSQRERLRDAPESHGAQKNLRRLAIAAFDSMLMELVEDFDDDDHVTGSVVTELAIYLSDELRIHPAFRPKFSQGWLHKFQRRNGLSFRKRYGEAASVDQEAARSGRERLQSITSQYALHDVYNMDETSFFYRQSAAGSISRRAKSGRKQDKRRLTLAVAANADGSDKLPLLIIGKTKQPRDLRGHDVSELGIEYTHSKKGWMTTTIYTHWLAALDEWMRDEGRHILLLVDNVSSHNDGGLTLTNVRVEPLPPNTTSLLQPMDQGIIASLKRRYMKKKTQAALRNFMARRGDPRYVKQPVDMALAFQWCSEAWYEMPAEVIRKCWLHWSYFAN